MLLWLLFVAFLIGTAVLVGMILFDTDQMPWLCPRCGSGSDEDVAGQHLHWYRSIRGGYRCRTCGTAFKEHPNGTLVEDRDR